jgi:hypothetical protein
MDLSAGKLPFERQVHALAPLDGEDLVIVFYDGAGDPHGFFSHVLVLLKPWDDLYPVRRI